MNKVPSSSGNHSISDNFVKRNLKKRKYFGKNEYRAKRLQRSKWKERRAAGKDGYDATQRSKDSVGGKASGLGVWGIDALNLSIKRFHSLPQKQSNGECQVPEKPSKLDSASSRYTEEEVKLFHQYAPKCTGHQMISKLFTVKKAGSNKGRYFYTCTYPMDQKCNFFLWVEDNPDLINSKALPQFNSPSDFSLQCYQKKLQNMTKDQLMLEMLQFNRRNHAFNAFSQSSEDSSLGSKFPVKGITEKKLAITSKNKEELITLLLDEVSRLLESHKKILDWLDLSPRQQKDGQPPASVDNKVESTGDMILLSDSEDDEEEEDSDQEETLQRPLNFSSKAIATLAPVSKCDSVDMASTMRIISTWYFGYSEFRSGQQWAIERCLAGKRSLLVMPTGYGKSLCYMLPSLLLPGITLVISPLIALMNDQMMKLPPELPAICLNSHLSTKEAAEACLAILNNRIKILFVSPEKFCSNSFRSLISQLHKKYGRDYVSLLCIDEAHCLSQWSYHFRPAFLRISREMKNVCPKAVLALTATATPAVAEDIIQHLDLATIGESPSASGSCFLRIEEVRRNLQLSAQYCDSDEQKKQSLVTLLSSLTTNTTTDAKATGRQKPLTIVYVWRRMDAEILNDYLKAVGIESVVYHGGLDRDRRSMIQKQFDRGNARCILATVAFGMGIDKQDIRQVIHYSLPKSIENYLQEIGRAGRDGDSSNCTLLFSREEAVLQSNYAFATQISVLQIFCVLIKLFPDSARSHRSNNSNTNTNSHQWVSISISEITQQLDIPDSVLETVLSILELPPYRLVSLERNHFDSIQGKFRILQDRFEKLMASRVTLEASLLTETDLEKIQSMKYQLLQRKLLQFIFDHNELTNTKSLKRRLPKFLSSQEEGESDYDGPESDSSDDEEAMARNYSLFHDDDQAEMPEGTTTSSGSATNSFVQQFRLSKTLIASHLNLSSDEVCDLLYQLQRSGILEYQLKEPHFLLQLFPQQLPQSASLGEHLRSLLDLSRQIYQRLQGIQQSSADAVKKMYGIGQMIAKHAPASTTTSRSSDNWRGRDSSSEALTSDQLHQFIQVILDQDHSQTKEELAATASSPFAVQIKEYQSIGSPFTAFRTAEEKIRLLTEKRILQNDVVLTQYFQYLHEYCQSELVQYYSSRSQTDQPSSSAVSIASTLHEVLQSEKSGFLLHYIMKILYGFSSNLLAMNGLRGELSLYSEFWNKYRLHDYQQVFTLLIKTEMIKSDTSK